MQFVNSLKLIINTQTVIITTLSAATTGLCVQFHVVANFPLTLIATAVVFPIVFSIGSAYKRREHALDEYGVIKAHARAIYFAVRDWVPETNQTLELESKELLFGLFQDMRQLFNTPIGQMEDKEQDVYASFSMISQFIKSLRSHGLPSGECSRCNQFLSKVIVAFESIKHIYQYRTPRTLRAFSHLFIYVLPVVYGPYFAFISKDFTPGLTYVIPILFSVIVVCLDNILDHLENPFDLGSEDDVMINADKFLASLDLQDRLNHEQPH